MSGGSRGIGLSIARMLAREGVHLVLLAKTVTKKKGLPGTIYSAAQELREFGVKVLPLKCDIRNLARL